MNPNINNSIIFHAAFPVKDIAATKSFYVDKLGADSGRETAASIILNFYGHQLVAHVTKNELKPQGSIYPRHLGLIFTNEEDFDEMEKKIKNANINFLEKPKTRFIGKQTEHRTMFIEDPFHNLLEFKFYKYPDAIWEKIEDASIGDPEAEN
ncbi:MAG: VOC family protein [Candidatus Caenarcaniphilales bacterium]|nr:VOC family protein [Candidatus Caenarcaniphilales bacterium]